MYHWKPCHVRNHVMYAARDCSGTGTERNRERERETHTHTHRERESERERERDRRGERERESPSLDFSLPPLEVDPSPAHHTLDASTRHIGGISESEQDLGAAAARPPPAPQRPMSASNPRTQPHADLPLCLSANGVRHRCRRRGQPRVHNRQQQATWERAHRDLKHKSVVLVELEGRHGFDPARARGFVTLIHIHLSLASLVRCTVAELHTDERTSSWLVFTQCLHTWRKTMSG